MEELLLCGLEEVLPCVEEFTEELLLLLLTDEELLDEELLEEELLEEELLDEELLDEESADVFPPAPVPFLAMPEGVSTLGIS